MPGISHKRKGLGKTNATSSELVHFTEALTAENGDAGFIEVADYLGETNRFLIHLTCITPIQLASRLALI